MADRLTQLIAQAYKSTDQPPPPLEVLTQLQQQWDAQDAAEREQAAPFAASSYLQSIGFPRENLNPEWGARVPANCRESLSAYADALAEHVAAGTGLFLGAGIGAGKTSMLALVALRARQLNINCAYVLAGWELVESCADARQPYADVALLLLDDLDYVSVAGFDGELRSWDAIGRFLYRRFAQSGATCIGSNLPFSQLAAKPGFERVASRSADRLPKRFRLQTTAGDQRTA